MTFEVLDVQTTPNPNALKFVLDRRVTAEPISFFNAEAANSHLLASRLFAIHGVDSVLLLNDFVTVNKKPTSRWTEIKKKVRQVLAAEAPTD